MVSNPKERTRLAVIAAILPNLEGTDGADAVMSGLGVEAVIIRS